MARLRTRRILLLLCGMLVVAGCDKVKSFDLFNKAPADEAAGASAPDSVKLVARDVEAPEVFSTSEPGLWDGRPSLGGVWVAYPDVKAPERVIIRNAKNEKFVIGALFRDERGAPGPKLKVSSDAAEALGMIAGAPQTLNVTALRREEVPISGETPEPAAEPTPDVETTTLDPIAAADAALDRAEAAEKTDTGNATAMAAPTSPAPPKASHLAKPYIQIGLYSVEANANRTGTVLRGAGVVPNIKKLESRGKSYWRVTVGPATTNGDRSALMKKIRGLGYDDAYYVTD